MRIRHGWGTSLGRTLSGVTRMLKPFSKSGAAFVVLAAIGVVSAGACEDAGGSNETSAPSPTPAEAFCRAHFSAACERLFRCDPDAAALIPQAATAAACAQAHHERVCDRLSADIAAGAVRVDLTGADACNDDLATASCGTAAEEVRRFLEAGKLDACPDVLGGDRAKGASCTAAWHCREPSSNCVAVASGAGECTGALSGDAFEIACSATSAGAGACPGLVCLGLNANQQGKSGLCTARCQSQADCGDGGVCVALTDGNICFSMCTSDADCGGGFVCVDEVYQPGPQIEGDGRACLVTLPSAE